jgi:polysaccharide export outer membrane protein
MNVLNAVALAGGFTYRAREGEVYIKHAGSNDEVAVDVDAGGKVEPGDIIRVRERFF